jgi:hypothetical protein
VLAAAGCGDETSSPDGPGGHHAPGLGGIDGVPGHDGRRRLVAATGDEFRVLVHGGRDLVREGANPCPDDELPAVAAFAAASGELTWSVCSTVEAYRFVLGATDEAVYVAENVEGATDLVAHRAADGGELWRRPLRSAGFVGGWPKGPTAGAGIIVIADGPRDDPPLVGLDAATGRSAGGSTNTRSRWRRSSAPGLPPSTRPRRCRHRSGSRSQAPRTWSC